jgi:hypothetical protein
MNKLHFFVIIFLTECIDVLEDKHPDKCNKVSINTESFLKDVQLNVKAYNINQGYKSLEWQNMELDKQNSIHSQERIETYGNLKKELNLKARIIGSYPV